MAGVWPGGMGMPYLLVKEPLPAASQQPVPGFVRAHELQPDRRPCRKAKFPPINTLNNAHPFLRYCCDKSWVFARSGLAPNVIGVEQVLSYLAKNFQSGDAEASCPCLTAFSGLVAAHGKLNFLMSDGDCLIA